MRQGVQLGRNDGTDMEIEAVDPTVVIGLKKALRRSRGDRGREIGSPTLAVADRSLRCPLRAKRGH
jgi:hypothetical protein